ncbi:MAG TPA: pentapeptide repeat-containing protein, partial [Candidatus Obscuribacterales bacterium]
MDKARCKKGWAKAEQAWADLAHTSPATLKRFWAGIAIASSSFRAICKAVGIEDWEAIVEFEDNSEFPSQISGKRLSFAIAVTIEEIDKHKLDAIVALLNQIGRDTSIGFVEIDDGSIRLILGGSEDALNRVEELFQSGELAEIEGIEVQDVHFLQKAEQVALLRKNGGEAQNLMRADLRGANLNCAELRGANLNRAILSFAILRCANLSDANLSGADLSRAYLSGAYLSHANLNHANLNHAKLSDAYLSG